MSDHDFIMRVLCATASDNCSAITWHVHAQYAPITFFVDCSDVFAWAHSDGEQLSPANIGEYERAVQDCEAGPYSGALFAARMRKRKPMKTFMHDLKRDAPNLVPLFEAIDSVSIEDKIIEALKCQRPLDISALMLEIRGDNEEAVSAVQRLLTRQQVKLDDHMKLVLGVCGDMMPRKPSHRCLLTTGHDGRHGDTNYTWGQK